ncbi:MAG: NADH-quinone oxidoreductase subunit NuoH [Armatimonadetes bacterium]|nr:NADH-quinone oxidoreductase subunit NuoH [Armatimonadota bacterium]
MTPGLWTLVIGVCLLAGLLGLTTGMIWIERRLLAQFQDRLGPNRVGPLGLFQPIADIIKLFMKEDWMPPFADKLIFVIAPGIIVVTVLLAFAVVPITPFIKVSDANVGLLFFLGMASMGVYGIVLAGWASNSKYSLIGGTRAAAQMLSYELPMGLAVVSVVMLAGSLRLSDIVNAQPRLWFCVLQPLGFVIFTIAGIAEARRTPFDLPEADSELIAGYHTEYSSMKFALFFMGEYLDIILVSAMVTVLYLGGWHGPLLPPALWFIIKMFAVIFLFVWVRAVLPRYRYDQLMTLGWKILLPLSIVNLVATGAVMLVMR